MGMIGTFDGFTTARLGIYAAQHGLRVTGNNISNINTSGYTRQRIDQTSLKTGSNDTYRSLYDNHVGNGALVTGINQVRDPYLDIRYRDTNASVGYTDTMLAGLKEIASVLDEVGKGDSNKGDGEDGLLYAQIQDVYKSLQQLSANPTTDNDTLVRNSAASLVQLFNTYAERLETLRAGMEDSLKQDVSSVNEILTNIRNLNEQIRRSDINGDNALEMRDERNRQIDKLSEYLSISVEYSMEDIGAGLEVERLSIRLGGANPDPAVNTDETVLIDGIYGSQLVFRDENSPYYDLNVTRLEDGKGRVPIDTTRRRDEVELADNDLGGSLQAQRELLTEKGEFATAADMARDPKATTKRGIQYYQKSLDLLARQFAEAYNELNNGTPVDQDGNPVADGGAVKLPAIKEENGTIYAWNEGTKEYEEKAGWGLEEVNGVRYAVETLDNKKYFTGLHGEGCFIYKKIPVDGGTEAIFEGLKGVEDVAQEKVKEIEDALGAGGNFDDKNVKDKVYALLADTLQGHGTTADSTVYVPVETGDLPKGGVLFSNRGDGDKTGDTNDPDDPPITAANISISNSWSTGDVRIVPTWTVLYGGTVTNSTQNENVDHMITKISESLDYKPQDLDPDAVGKKLFSGSFNDMYSNMCSVLGNDQRIANVQLNTNHTTLVELDSSREGVSGVDLNDEAMNMMQYQKAYSAACRMMTAVDELIDRLINNTGIVGR